MADRLAPVVVITGTDTGVGKTWVAAALARHLAGAGRRVGVVKPVETGWPDAGADLAATDAARLAEAAGDPDPLERIAPWRFAEALAPALAARRAGVVLALDDVRRCIERKRAGCDVLLVEGAGGLLVPLAGDARFVDLVTSLGGSAGTGAAPPVLVVAANRLGVLNQVLLTVEALERRGLRHAVVLNELAPPRDLAERTNAAVLEERLGERFAGTIDAGAAPGETGVWLARHLAPWLS